MSTILMFLGFAASAAGLTVGEDVGPNLSGVWELNVEASDQPPSGGGGPAGRRGSGGGSGGRPPMPTRLEIEHEGDVVRVDGGRSRPLEVNTSWTEWQASDFGEVRAFWEDLAVVVERRRQEGPALRTSYTINPNGQLVVVSKPPRGRREVKRVYDRVDG